MSKFFNEIVAPQLTQTDYGQGIESMVNNINANFQKVFTLPFLKGDDGDRLTTRFCPFWDETAKLTEEGYKIFKTIFVDEKIKNGITFENIEPGCTLRDLMAELDKGNLFNDSENSGKDQFVQTYGPEGDPKILLYYQIDTESNNETLLGAAQLYYFFDPRVQGLSDFIGVNNTESVEGFVDYTCILSTKYVNGDQEYSYGYEKQSGWPTLYFDSSSKQFCWQINGQKTGVNAQGVNGRDGRGSKIWLCIVKPTAATEAGQTMSTNVDYSKGKYTRFEITDIWVPKLNEWLNINTASGYTDTLNALGESGMPSSGDLFIAYLYSEGKQSIEVPVYTIVGGEWVKTNETEIFNKPPMSIYGTLSYDAQANDDKKYYVFSNISQNLYRTTDNTVLVDMLNHIGDYTGDNSSASNGVQDPMCITKGLFVPLRDKETDGDTHKFVHVLYNDRDNGSLNLKVDALANVVDVHESQTDVKVDKEKKNLNIIYNTTIDGTTKLKNGLVVENNNVSINKGCLNITSPGQTAGVLGSKLSISSIQDNGANYICSFNLHNIGTIKFTNGNYSDVILSDFDNNTILPGSLKVAGVTTLEDNVSIGGITTIGNNIIPTETDKFSLGINDKIFNSVYSHNIIGTYDVGSKRGIYGLKWESGDLHFITSKDEYNKPYIYVYENTSNFSGGEHSYRMSLLSQYGVRIYKNIYIGVPTGGNDTSINETAKMNINSSTGSIYTSGQLEVTGKTTLKNSNLVIGNDSNNNLSIDLWKSNKKYNISIDSNHNLIIKDSSNSYDMLKFNSAGSSASVATFANKVVATTFKGELDGNASSATKLKNARTFKIGGVSKSFDGTADVTITKNDMELDNVKNTAFYERVTTVNNTDYKMAGTVNGIAFKIFAPTSAGSSGQVLVSSGGTPSWSTGNVGSSTRPVYMSGGVIKPCQPTEFSYFNVEKDSSGNYAWSYDFDEAGSFNPTNNLTRTVYSPKKFTQYFHIDGNKTYRAFAFQSKHYDGDSVCIMRLTNTDGKTAICSGATVYNYYSDGVYIIFFTTGTGASGSYTFRKILEIVKIA